MASPVLLELEVLRFNAPSRYVSSISPSLSSWVQSCIDRLTFRKSLVWLDWELYCSLCTETCYFHDFFECRNITCKSTITIAVKRWCVGYKLNKFWTKGNFPLYMFQWSSGQKIYIRQMYMRSIPVFHTGSERINFYIFAFKKYFKNNDY